MQKKARVGALAAAGVALTAAAALALGSSSARGQVSATHGAAASSSVTVGATLAPPTLDMTANAAAAIPEVLLYNVYEGLVKLDQTGAIKPLLARSWTQSNNGLVYTFKLRPDVRFQNGDAFSARDVVFSYKRVIAPKSTHPHKDEMAPVKSVVAVNGQTVRITLKNRSWNFLYSLTDPVGVIYDSRAISTIATKPVGTGPYSFQAMNRGFSVTLVKNPRYWGTPAALDKVSFRYYTDPNALINAEKAGDIDIIDNVPEPQQLKDFSGNGKYKVVQGYTNGEVVLSMNNSKAPLNNKLVRQAINYAIDRPQLIKTAYAGYGKLIGTHASPGDPWYLDLSKQYPYDPAKAKQLLAQAGFSKGITLTLQLPPVNYARSGGEFVAAQLEQVGIHTTIQNVEWPLWLDQVFGKANYDLTIVAHVEARDIIKYADPSYYWRYDNPTVQKLIADGDKAPTLKQSIADYQKVERIIANDAVNDWLFLLPALQVVRSGITGYPTNSISLSFDLTGMRRS